MSRSIITFLTVAGMALAALLPGTFPAQSEPRFDDAEREEIGEIIRDYLLENPRILEEVIEALEREQAATEMEAQQQLILEYRDEIFESPDSYVAGNPEGDVTLVEFFDYNCQYCRRMMPVVAELIEEDPELRVVFKDWPVLGEGSTEAARVATAVRLEFPDQYVTFHQHLLSEQGRIDRERALAAAGEIGLSRDALEDMMDDPEVNAILRRSGQLGGQLGLRGTPSYVIGDEIVGGAVGKDVLESAIAEVREEGCAVC